MKNHQVLALRKLIQDEIEYAFQTEGGYRFAHEVRDKNDLAWHEFVKSFGSDGRLKAADVEALVQQLCANPDDARRFLWEAGLIDEDGQLSAPYRS